MNFKSALFLFFVLATVGCKQSQQDESSHYKKTSKLELPILVEDSMVNVLVEIQLLEASLQLQLIKSADQYTGNSNTIKILHQHGITKEQFENSLLFYIASPEKFNPLYKKVIKSLEDRAKTPNK